mgnify:CR=1 FL=1
MNYLKVFLVAPVVMLSIILVPILFVLALTLAISLDFVERPKVLMDLWRL